MDLRSLLCRKIVVLDGAMGTALLSRGKSGVVEMCNVECAEDVVALHEEYLKAGADIITTNSTCADALCLKERGLQECSYELAKRSAELAKEAAARYSTTENPRFVAGSVGPTSRNLTLANDVTAEDVAAAYATLVAGLADGGVDLILIETAMDAQNVTLAVEQVRKVAPQMPIILSVVLSRIEGRVASGATIAKFFEDVPMQEIEAVGFNCTMGVKQMEAAVKALQTMSDKRIILYPSAVSPMDAPNRFAKALEKMCRASELNIVGGCCGTDPSYIEYLAKVAARWRPRKIK